MGSNDFLTVQKPQSRVALLIVGGVVFLGAIGAAGGIFYFSYGSSQADEPQDDAAVQESQDVDQIEQSPQGLTVDDPAETSVETRPEDDLEYIVDDPVTQEGEDSPDSQEERSEEADASLENLPEIVGEDDQETIVNEYEEEADELSPDTDSSDSNLSVAGDEIEISLSAEQENVQVGEPYTVTLAYSSASSVTAFDILLSFDPDGFDISKDDIISINESFDTFAFYKEHDDGRAHLSISGVKAPGQDVADEEGGDILEVTFIPTQGGTYDFTVLDTFKSESTKFVNTEDETMNPYPPEPITVQVDE
jgi:hypothetical protein